jgi:Fe-S cluster assembly protein SufD
VETTPQLEIYADDVKCSHGATTGRLDEDALFYMRTRGVPEAEAKVLQMISFLAAVTPEDRKEEIENAVNRLV